MFYNLIIENVSTHVSEEELTKKAIRTLF